MIIIILSLVLHLICTSGARGHFVMIRQMAHYVSNVL